MKTITAFLLAISFPLAAWAQQDSQGRSRVPPSGGGNRGSESSGRSGGDSSGSSGGNGGGAVRRSPPSAPVDDRSGSGTVSSIRAREAQPPTQGPKGESLERAVRRDSLPPRSETEIIGRFGDPRMRDRDEWERNHYYWHEYYGRRYSHYIDPYGEDWYFWYNGDTYYSMRYYNGFWWRHDAVHDHWCYLDRDRWYYEEGGRKYVYDEGSQGYKDSEPLAAPAFSLTLNLGGLGLADPGSRDEGDVLARDAGFLNFDQSRLNNVVASAGVSVGVGNNFEVGADAGYYKGTAPSNYTDYVRPDGSEIVQRLSLQKAPVTVAGKWFPFGRDNQFQPYVGGGLGIDPWWYQENGDFVDFAADGNPVYKAAYKANGVAFGPVAIAGLRFPINNRVAIGGEYRHLWAQGALPSSGGFAGDHIDLGDDIFQAGLTFTLK